MKKCSFILCNIALCEGNIGSPKANAKAAILSKVSGGENALAPVDETETTVADEAGNELVDGEKVFTSYDGQLAPVSGQVSGTN